MGRGRVLTIPPLPSPVLQIGLIGHRALPGADAKLLGETAKSLLDRIRAAALAVLGDHSAPVRGGLQMRCVSSLAEGADSILADAALERDYALLCPLPFRREVYEQDFAPGEKLANFRRLLGRAAAVYEIDGAKGNSESYQAAGRLLLEQSDIVMAVWDGSEERGVGGTGQMVREAMQADIPLIVIDAAAPHAVRVIGEPNGADISNVLDEWMSRLLIAPKATGKANPVAIYASETLSEARWAARLNTGVERLLLLGSRPSPSAAPAAGDEAIPAAVVKSLAEISRVIEPHLAAADQLAIRYAALYRAAATLRYLAVLPATVAALLAFYAPPFPSRVGFSIQLVILVGILLIAWIDRRLGWHRRFLDYRYIAEHLRQSRLLALFGSTAAVPRLPRADEAAASDWVDWHLRSIIRSLGLISARGDPDFVGGAGEILSREADQQKSFYEARAHRFRLLADRLRKIGTALFMVGLAFTVIRIGMAIADMSGPLYDLAAELALAVPALAPIFFGLSSQNEYGRLSQRYEATARKLGRMRGILPWHSGSHAKLELMARETVSAMLAEVSGWRQLIKARDLSPF